MNVATVDAGIVYTVRLKDPGAHLIEVSCRITEPDPQGQVFSLPNWIPGSYMIRDYARHVVSIEGSSAGESVALTRLDKSTWRATPVDDALLISAEVYANDLSVRGACFDFDRVFFNGVCLFFRVHGQDASRVVMHVDPGEHVELAGWQVATAMRRLTGTEHEFGAFEAANYEELIDHPVLAGQLDIVKFEVAGVPHQFVMIGRHNADRSRLAADLQRVCQAHADFFGAPLPMDRYLFLTLIINQGYGGLEHGSSSALICSRTDLPVAGVEAVTPAYARFLGLVSHEYFHLWNVKRIRPTEFARADLRDEAYTRQLWVFEGITSYYDDLGLLRGGLIDTGEYLRLLGQTLSSVYQSRGRRRQTLEDSSFDAWTKFYKRDENFPNAVVSYYSKGAMVALALDLELRLRSKGRCSLDDVMVALWQRCGLEEGRSIAEGGFEQFVEEFSGLDLGEFFRQSVRNTVDPPVGILLAQFGIRLHLRPRESAADTGGTQGQREARPRAWLGITTRKVAERIEIASVLADGPARSAGLAAGDELVAIDGFRVDRDRFDSCLDALETERPVAIHVFRQGLLREVEVLPARPPRDVCYLTLESSADEATLARRRAWLGD